MPAEFLSSSLKEALASNEQPKPNAVMVALASYTPRGEIALYVIRTQNSNNDSLLTFPGGKIESGEKPEQAALREIYEEIGVQLNSLQFVALAKTPDRSGTPMIVIGYVSDKWKGQPHAKKASEVEEGKFVTRTELIQWMRQTSYSDISLLQSFDLVMKVLQQNTPPEIAA